MLTMDGRSVLIGLPLSTSALRGEGRHVQKQTLVLVLELGKGG